jgi:hypothetical protein
MVVVISLSLSLFLSFSRSLDNMCVPGLVVYGKHDIKEQCMHAEPTVLAAQVPQHLVRQLLRATSQQYEESSAKEN